MTDGSDDTIARLRAEQGVRSQTQCPECQGEGRIALGEHFVTREMALDAGEPQMEGQSMGIEWERCKRCYGDGWIIKDRP